VSKSLDMKKLYPLILVCVLSTACSKDFLKSYEDRIEGTWRLVDVDRRGIGGSIDNLPFQDGEFVFSEGGGLKYTNNAGTVYQGSWDISREWRDNGCYTDNNGNYNCDDREVKTLSIVAVDFATQQIRSENFEEMEFTGTNRFNAYIYSGLHTYVFRFRR
jgi:hypothetical protein